MPDPRPTFAYLVTALRDKHPKMAYLHVPEPRVAGNLDVTPTQDENNDFLRQIWNSGDGGAERVFISAGGYIRETALRTAEDKRELIAFGRLYISSVLLLFHSSASALTRRLGLHYQPDLPVRLQKNLPLTPKGRSTYYLLGDLTPHGYNDWPFADGNVHGIDESSEVTRL